MTMSIIKVFAGTIGLTIVLLLVPTGGAHAQVFAVAKGEVVNASHDRVGTTITVTYDLISSDPTATFKVALVVSIAGMEFKAQSVTGDIGDRVTPGRRKKITWQSASDVENQEYDKFNFKVTASSSVLTPVNTDKAPATPMDLRGRWIGTYAGSAMAELLIDRQDGSRFTGTLFYAKKKNDEPTELSIEGSVSAQLIELREVKVVKPGKQENWKLGSGSGSLQLQGQQMVGTGADRRAPYMWSFSRQNEGGLMTESPAPPATLAEATSDLSGSWEGTYSGFPAQLTLTASGASTFSGTLMVTTSKGKASTDLAVECIVTGSTVSLRETSVLARGASSNWNLGTASGMLQPDNRQMGGSGKDTRRSYQWSLTKK